MDHSEHGEHFLMEGKRKDFSSMVTLECFRPLNPEKLLPLSFSKFTVHLTQLAQSMSNPKQSLSGQQELSVCFVHGEASSCRAVGTMCCGCRSGISLLACDCQNQQSSP